MLQPFLSSTQTLHCRNGQINPNGSPKTIKAVDSSQDLVHIVAKLEAQGPEVLIELGLHAAEVGSYDLPILRGHHCALQDVTNQWERQRE